MESGKVIILDAPESEPVAIPRRPKNGFRNAFALVMAGLAVLVFVSTRKTQAPTTTELPEPPPANAPFIVTQTTPDIAEWLWSTPLDIGVLDDLAAGDLGFLAVGNDWNRSSFSFSSSDGISWSYVKDPEGVLRYGEVAGVAGTERGFVAVGSRRTAGETDGVAWVYEGGRWTRSGLPQLGARSQLYAVTSYGDRIFASGWQVPPGWESWDGDLARWEEPPTTLRPFTLSSADGYEWMREPEGAGFPVFGYGRFHGQLVGFGGNGWSPRMWLNAGPEFHPKPVVLPEEMMGTVVAVEETEDGSMLVLATAGHSGRLFLSRNTVDWEEVPRPLSAHGLYKVDDWIIATTNIGTEYLTKDGRNWQIRLNLAYPGDRIEIAEHNGVTVATRAMGAEIASLGGNEPTLSIPLATGPGWRSLPPVAYEYVIGFPDGLAALSNGAVMWSPDGSQWAALPDSPEGVVALFSLPQGLAAYIEGGTLAMWVHQEQRWIEMETPGADRTGLATVALAGDRVIATVATASGVSVYTTTDFANWKTVPLPFNASWVQSLGNAWLATSYEAPGLRQFVSSDLENWLEVPEDSFQMGWGAGVVRQGDEAAIALDWDANGWKTIPSPTPFAETVTRSGGFLIVRSFGPTGNVVMIGTIEGAIVSDWTSYPLDIDRGMQQAWAEVFMGADAPVVATYEGGEMILHRWEGDPTLPHPVTTR